jgi:tetratricopeptide (TPR) repeat protein
VTSDAFARARELAERALDMPPEERLAYLEETCASEPDLLRTALELAGVALDDGDDGFLDPLPASGPPGTPSRIGRYPIVGVIASGGMGTVYEALQDNPRRVVAIKTLRHGVASPSTLRRFDVELETLAGLRHPAIAQVIEGGIHSREGDPNPVPYFVLERVEGATDIVTHARTNQLSTHERLLLFLVALDAVQYGHDRGVIHRDLKPANILIDVEGHLKLIDYGVAHVRGIDPSRRPGDQEKGQIVGTIAFMAPETLASSQSGEDVRIDVYALGVCLYELLADRRPIDLTGHSSTSAMHRLLTEEPAPLRSVKPSMPAELEWIVARALERDPADRYPSVQALADDLRRHLDGEAVTAAPPSTLYQLRKFAARNRVSVVAGVMALLGVAATFAVTLRSLQTERDLRTEAEQSRHKAQEESMRTSEVAGFLTGLFKRLHPQFDGPDVLAIDMLEAAAQEVDMVFLGRGDLEADVRVSLAAALSHANKQQGAIDQLELALERLRENPARNDLAEGQVLRSLAECLLLADQLDEAEEVARQAVGVCNRALGPTATETCLAVMLQATIDHERGRLDRAARLAAPALEQLLENEGWDSPNAPGRAFHTVRILAEAGQLDQASDLAERALAASLESTQYDRLAAIRARDALASVRGLSDRTEDAIRLMRESLQLREELYGPDHDSVLYGTQNLGMHLANDGQFAEAEELLLDLVARLAGRPLTRLSPPTHNELGRVLLETGRPSEARDQLLLSIETAEALGSDGQWQMAGPHKYLSFALRDLGDPEGAERELVLAYHLLADQLGEENERSREMARELVHFFEQAERPDAVAAWRTKLD